MSMDATLKQRRTFFGVLIVLAVIGTSIVAHHELRRRQWAQIGVEALEEAGLSPAPPTARDLSANVRCGMAFCAVTVRFTDQPDAIRKWKAMSHALVGVVATPNTVAGLEHYYVPLGTDRMTSVLVNNTTGTVTLDIALERCDYCEDL